MASKNFNKKILQIGDQSKQIYKQSVILREHHMVLSYLQGRVAAGRGKSSISFYDFKGYCRACLDVRDQRILVVLL